MSNEKTTVEQTMSNTFDYDVFLSYSSQDEQIVHALAERLKQEGLRVWLDAWVIQPGDPISLKIQHGLEKSRTLLMCMSRAYFDSEWAKLEHHTLLFRDPTNKKRRFIPLLIEDCTPPDIIAQFKRIDWRMQSGEEYDKLLASCRGGGAETNPIQNDPTTKKFKTLDEIKDLVKRFREIAEKNKKRLAIIIIMFTIIIIAIWMLWPINNSKVSVDDYAFPSWVDSEALQDPAKDKSIRWEYKIDSKGLSGYRLLSYRLLLVTVNLDLEKEHDISNYTGISFSVKADKSINETNLEDTPLIEFLVHTNKDRGYIYWTGKNNRNMEISEEWMNKTILFSDLKIAHWTNNSKTHPEPNLKKVYAFNFAAPTSTHRSNIIWFYDIKLVHKDGNETSIATGNVPVLAPEEPLHGEWTTPRHIPRLSIIDKGV